MIIIYRQNNHIDINMIVYFYGCGGLGNVLFQLSSAIHYCEQHNFELKIIKTHANLYGTSNYFGKTKCLQIDNQNISYDKTIFSKLQFVDNVDGEYITVHNDFTCDTINPEEKNIRISGHNQNLGLFSSVMNKIPNYLFLDDANIKRYILEKYPNIENSTIICVRIGFDFKHMNKIQPESYLKAIDYLKLNDEPVTDLFVMSDIPTHTFFNNKLTSFIEIDEPDIVQIYAGLLAKNLILSESTFHLWIAYLSTNFGENTDKNVICFNNTDITTRDFNLDGWITLDY